MAKRKRKHWTEYTEMELLKIRQEIRENDKIHYRYKDDWKDQLFNRPDPDPT